jgi:hypothetical protein
MKFSKFINYNIIVTSITIIIVDPIDVMDLNIFNYLSKSSLFNIFL